MSSPQTTWNVGTNFATSIYTVRGQRGVAARSCLESRIRILQMGPFLFECELEVVPQAFARNDPYVRAGLVTRWWTRHWITVVGDNAPAPVHST